METLAQAGRTVIEFQKWWNDLLGIPVTAPPKQARASVVHLSATADAVRKFSSRRAWLCWRYAPGVVMIFTAALLVIQGCW
ncbi:MAG: hypothetical protein AB8H80_15405 [Planctomycetota bacterium]